MLPTKQAKKIGDCEVCDKVAVEVWIQPGNILMCIDCLTAETAALERNLAAKNVIEESRKIDSSITLKADVFTAKTVSMIELRGAINANDDIPAAEKDRVFADECMVRYKGLNDAIFNARAALTELENERRMWQVNGQEAAGKVRADYRAEHYKEWDINFSPTPIKKQNKTTKPVSISKPFDKVAVFAAAKKFGVSATDVQMRLVAGSNKTPDKAAEYLCEQIAKKHGIDAAMLKAAVIGRGISAEDKAIELKKLFN